MARRRPTAEELSVIRIEPEPPSAPSPAQKLAAMCRKKKPSGRPRSGPRASTVRSQIDEVQEIVSSPDRWEEMTPARLVALYAWLHSEVYGVDPSAELAGKGGLGARGMARRMVEEQFQGDRAAAVEFVRWTWRKEKRSEQWRRDNGRDGRRISWRLQFSPSLVNEYRVALRRQQTEALSTRVESA